MRLVGQMFSMGIAMMLFSVYVGKARIFSANLGAFLHAVKGGFLIFSALCFAGVFDSLARGNKKQS
jgi:hypothetical protein